MEILAHLVNLGLNIAFIYSITILLKYVWLVYCAYKEEHDVFSLINIDLPISISYFIGFLLS